MIVRLLLAVIITAALIGASMPAIEAAQQAQADVTLTRSVDRIDAAATELSRHSDPAPPGVPAATRRVEVDVPAAASGRLTVGPSKAKSTANKTEIRTTIKGEAPSATVIEPVVRPADGEGGVEWTGASSFGDSTTLTLEYRLVEGRPVVVLVRGFK
ncbi:MAG: DUF7311 family protein [Halodesulfurarchaeum sp.]